MSKQVAVKKNTTTAAVAAPKVEQPAAPVSKPLAYHLADGFRPEHGNLLKAHTEAFFRVTDMVNGKRVPTSLAQTVLGKAAVSWHTKKGNFDITAQGLGLSDAGELKFGLRGINEEFCAAYVAVMTEGTLQPGVGVKAEVGIKKL